MKINWNLVGALVVLVALAGALVLGVALVLVVGAVVAAVIAAAVYHKSNKSDKDASKEGVNQA